MDIEKPAYPSDQIKAWWNCINTNGYECNKANKDQYKAG